MVRAPQALPHFPTASSSHSPPFRPAASFVWTHARVYGWNLRRGMCVSWFGYLITDICCKLDILGPASVSLSCCKAGPCRLEGSFVGAVLGSPSHPLSLVSPNLLVSPRLRLLVIVSPRSRSSVLVCPNLSRQAAGGRCSVSVVHVGNRCVT